jgi:hypothetical protein
MNLNFLLSCLFLLNSTVVIAGDNSTGRRKYPCTFEGCGWAFKTKCQLTDHKLTHNSTKKFSCSIKSCDYSSNRLGDLNGHIKRMHLFESMEITYLDTLLESSTVALEVSKTKDYWKIVADAISDSNDDKSVGAEPASKKRAVAGK